ncbi:ABC transporter permease [Taibaiella soli]|uniref:ABC transporter permease n=2 Tax=Taibaiella soli TaxID=1649169 RepID=A0A2W2BCS3_9BACT|nr:ABC transporter permease [Taibaiella soli]
MTNRWFKDAGIHPLIGYVLAMAAFVGISAYLFYKTPYAVYVYPLLALSLAGKLSELKRNDFLSQCFPKRKLNQLRITENVLAVLPFVFFLCYKQYFLFACVLPLFASLLAFARFRTTANITIPTPFAKKPFEFIVGFRNSFYLFLLTYAVSLIACFVGNFNLGLFALMISFGVCLFFYVKPEHEYFVWSYKLDGRQFLLRKIATALLHVSVIVLPIVLLLGCFFYHDIGMLLLFLAIGYAFLIYMIVAKYAAYPSEMSLMQTILLAVCIAMPLFLIVLIPYFFCVPQNI